MKRNFRRIEKQAIEFLRDRRARLAIANARNRISFASELASLMWFHNEKGARKMMNEVVSDFKRFLRSTMQQ